MARKWVAVYNEEDMPYGDEIRISIEGVECGFVAIPENGDDLGLYPADTEEEAREADRWAARRTWLNSFHPYW